MRILAIIAVYLTSAVVAVASIVLVVVNLGWTTPAFALLGVALFATLDFSTLDRAPRRASEPSDVTSVQPPHEPARTPTLRLVGSELIRPRGGA